MFIDTHTHLYTEEFDADRHEVVSRAFEAGAGALLLPNINAETIDPMLDMCRQWPGRCFPMMGLHPTEFTSDPFPTLQAMHQLLQTNARYIGVGEVGLDFYYDEAPDADLQIQVLQEQTRWAVEFQLPLMIHSRSAHRQLVDTLLPLPRSCRAVCSTVLAAQLTKPGSYLSVFHGSYWGLAEYSHSKSPPCPRCCTALCPSRASYSKQTPPIWPPRPIEATAMSRPISRPSLTNSHRSTK